VPDQIKEKTMNKRNWMLAVMSVITVFWGLQAQAALYVFGDSMSDAGNVLDASIAAGLNPDPPPPYYQGRMSNGPNWADYLAADLGYAPLSASRTGGTNYAWAGATTGGGVTNRRSLVDPGQTQPVDNVGTQIDNFTADHGGFASNDLVLHWSGGNDILYYALSYGSGGVPSVSAAVADLVSLTQSNLIELEGLGATRILLPNQIDASKSPIWSGIPGGLPAALQPYVSAVTQGFNAQLPGLIAALEGTAGFEAEIIFVDVYTVAEQVIADPAAYGFVDVTSPVLPLLSLGADPNEYLFWDPIHPTTAGHRLIADAAMAELVPEPSILLLLMTGLMAMGGAARRQLR
jgi:outer membrane lipase/esterase